MRLLYERAGPQASSIRPRSMCRMMFYADGITPAMQAGFSAQVEMENQRLRRKQAMTMVR